MKLTPEEILNNLHILLSNNVIGDRQLMSRYKGFKGELDFQENKRTGTYLNGGIIISKDSGESSLLNSIYFTIISLKENLDDYLLLYEKLNGIGFEKMFVCQYDESRWEEKEVMLYDSGNISLPVPAVKVYDFDADKVSFSSKGEDILKISDCFENENKRGKNAYPINDASKYWLIDQLKDFSNESLIDLYVNRLVFDGYIGFAKKKGKPSDIDFIRVDAKGVFKLIEVKEKDLPKRAKKGFGLDIPRIKDFKKIQDSSGLNYALVVRHINNQRERKLVEWLAIAIDDFIQDVKDSKAVEGGTGMRGVNSRNPTLICSYEKFTKV